MTKENKNQTGKTPKEEPVQNPVGIEIKQEVEVNNETAEETPKEEILAGVPIIVVKRFRDKYDPAHWYEKGEVLSFEAERAENVVRRGMAEYV